MSNIKAVRFSEDESKQVERFLKANPGLDFSTLVRLAVFKLMNAPRLRKIATHIGTKQNTTPRKQK